MSDHTNKKIADAMASIDGMTPAEPKPFLLTRVNAAIRRNASADRTVWGSIAAVIKKPVVAFAALAVVVFVNAVAISSNSTASGKQGVAARSASTKYDFAVNVGSIYDTENMEP
jgi:hypothetical protein